MFRAIEGDNCAYVMPLTNVFRHWPALQRENQEQVTDSPYERLYHDFGIRSVVDGAAPVRPPLPGIDDARLHELGWG